MNEVRDVDIIDVDIILDAAWVITMNSEREIFADGAVAIAEGRIVQVGKSDEIHQKFRCAKRIGDGTGVVLPGMVNAHRHLLTAPKGAAPEGRVSLELLRDFVYPAYSSLSEEELHAYTLHHAAEMLRFGTTLFEEPGCYHLEAVMDALDTVGIRARLGPWTWDQKGAAGEVYPEWLNLDTDQAILRLEDGIDTVRRFGSQRLKDAVTIEGVATCSDRLNIAASELAVASDSLLVTHKASSHECVQLELSAFGHRPVEHMFKIGALNEHVLLNHATCVEEYEIDYLAETGTRISQNPSSALKLAKGTTRTGLWPEFLERGIVVGLGTDAENCSNHQDIVRSMYLAALLPRDARRDPSAVRAEDAVEMATLGGARALRWDDEVGSLEVGKAADVVLFNTFDFDWRPLHDPVANLVYGATGYSVDTVLVHGDVLVEGGTVLSVDVPEIRETVQEIDNRVLERIGNQRQPAWPVR